jgi:hypothetical protein
MTKFLRLALLLGIVQLVVGGAVAALVFKRVDLRFTAFLSLVLIPVFQAAVLLWVNRDPATRPLFSAPRILRNPLALTLLCADAAILVLVITRMPHLQKSIFSAHAVLAATFLVALASRVARRLRAPLILIGTGLLLYAATAVWDWLALLPDMLGRSATVLRWAAVYAPLFCLAIGVLLWCAAALARQSLAAAGWLEIATALLLLSALIVVSNVFFHPFLVEPWKTIRAVTSYASVTAMLLAAITAALPARASDAS